MSRKIVWKQYVSFLFIIICTSTEVLSSAAVSIASPYSELQWLNNPSGNDWWSTFGHDGAHSGFSTTTTPDDDQLLWSYQTNYAVSSSPTVSHGRVYVGSWDWNLYCFDMDSGDPLWNFSTENQIASSPAVANGKVYVGSQDSKLYCLDAIDGTFLWDFKTDFIVDTSPTVVDSKVFFGSSDGSLYCLNADDGTLLWEYQTQSVIVSSPAVTAGNVYFGVTNGDFLCLNSTTGSLVWTFTMTDGTYSSPNINDGKIYFGSNDKNVYCLDADDGSLIWNYSALSEVHSSPAIAYGFVYVGTSDGRMLCLDKDTGGFVWSYLISGSVESSPSVADGKVYFDSDPCCGFTSFFVCLDAYTGTKIWDYNFGTQLHTKSSPALAAGKVFVGSGDGRVFAFGGIEYLADANGPYYGFVTTSIDFTGSVYGGQPSFTWYWDLGDGATSTDKNPSHIYTSVGQYTITLTVTDALGHIATDDTEVFIETPNSPPEIPTIDGPTTGRPGEFYEYSITSSDSNGDNLFYFIDWGDNMTSGWIGPFFSGAIIHQEHVWSDRGSYMIKAKVKDQHGAESNWSNPIEMTISAPQLDIEIKGGLGVTVTIFNTGDAPATSVSWNVTMDNGFIFYPFRFQIILNLMPGGKIPERMLVFGFGKTTVTCSAMCDEGISVNKSVEAKLLLFFVVGLK
ncbi:MAG TPA: hypothetical protein DSN98_04650 [Thermoplasmata archaeon]|nr:MAG TPA: hypothetical protein DSN98_04650 [Thermoplasmata archaeon]